MAMTAATSTALTSSPPQRITSAVQVELGDEASPVLVRWTSRREGESGFGSGGHSYALRTASGVVLVDPYRIDGEADGRIARLIDNMSEGSPPIAILCTDSWHEHAAYDVSTARGVLVWLPRAGAAEMDGQPDYLYDEATVLPAGIRGTHLEDLLGNTALLARSATGESVLFGGDCVLGGSGEPGHWRETVGMNLWLTGRHERAAFVERFGRLLALDVDLVCAAHGPPRRLPRPPAHSPAPCARGGRAPPDGGPARQPPLGMVLRDPPDVLSWARAPVRGARWIVPA